MILDMLSFCRVLRLCWFANLRRRFIKSVDCSGEGKTTKHIGFERKNNRAPTRPNLKF